MSMLNNLKTRSNLLLHVVMLVAGCLAACAPTPKRDVVRSPTQDTSKKQEIKNEQRAFIAHEFFLRARQQEMEGNDAVALSYFQIAYEYDPESRDLCFLFIDKLKAAGKMDSALATGLRCLDLQGQPESRELQAVGEIYLRKGDVKNALIHYENALALDDQDKDLLYTLSTLYESLKDMQKHVAVTDKLLSRVEYPMQMVEKQVQNLRALGKVDEVAKLYRAAWDKTGNAVFGEKLAFFFEEQELYSSLLELARQLAAENPENLPYESQKARALIFAGQPDSAIAAYEIMIKKNPEERESMAPYATLLYEKGRFPEAKEWFQKLLHGQPNNPIFHFFLGSISMELKEWNPAEAEFKKAVELDGKVPEYWAKLAVLYVQEGQEQKALDLIGKMDGNNEKDWYACYIQGIIFTQVAKRLETEQKFIPPKPADSVRIAVDTTAIQARRFREQGVAYLRKAQTLEGNNRRVLFELGVALEQLNKRGESIEVMKKLVKLDSSDATILNYLGYMLLEENQDLEYAGTLIERALQIEPGNGAFLDSKGWFYYLKQDFPQARKFIQMALDRIPQDTTILEHYALILEKLGMEGAAMEKWRLILKLDPEHDLAHRKLN